MTKTALCKYWQKNNLKKLPAFETDVNNKIYIMTVTCCFCLVYMGESL